MVKKRKNSVAVIFNGYKNSVRFGLKLFLRCKIPFQFLQPKAY